MASQSNLTSQPNSASTWALQLILRVKSAWPKLSKETAALYATYFDTWAGSFGKERVEQAVESAIGQYGEVPSLSGLRSVLSTVMAEHRQEKRFGCSQCVEGWIIGEDRRARACECRKAARR